MQFFKIYFERMKKKRLQKKKEREERKKQIEKDMYYHRFL